MTLSNKRSTTGNPLFKKGNYDYLYESIRNYSTLLGSSFDLKYDPKDFNSLHDYFKGIIPNGQKIQIVEIHRKLYYEVFFGEDFFRFHVCLIPIKKLNSIEGRIRDILLAFLITFDRYQALDCFNKTSFYEGLVQTHHDIPDVCDTEQDKNYMRGAYKNGYIDETFNLIYDAKTIRKPDEIKQMITRYHPASDWEKELIKVIETGLDLVFNNYPITMYVINTLDEELEMDPEDYGYYIKASTLLAYVYDSEDYICEQYLVEISELAGNYGNDIIKRPRLLIKPDSPHLLQENYPEQFFNWLYDFIQLIEEPIKREESCLMNM